MLQCIKDLSTILTTSDGLAACFNLTRTRIIGLAKEGVLKKDKDAKYNVQENFLAYVNYLKPGDKDKINTAESQAAYWEEKAKHEKSKRELADIEVKKAKNEVHTAKDVEKVMAHMLSTIRTKLLGLSSTLTPVLVNRSKEEINNIIATTIEDILSELKDYKPGMFTDEKDN
ncbi:hypothetical protein LJC10_00585 [Selenomonadales bacterium OttesenSCG-928-I06]|nr:hypothetical protein [Selenomonadales bacterium OttesenSCG-928-I06]